MSGSDESPGHFALVVFDLDGVLVDTSACHARAYADLWRMIGLTTGPAYEVIAGRTTRDSIVDWTAGMKPTARQLDEWVAFKQQQARHYLSTEVRLFPDSVSTLEAAARRRLTLALGTSASRVTSMMVLRQFDLLKFFPAIVTGDDVTHGKPAPDIYVRAAEAAGGDIHQSLVVEDSASGLAAALAAGAFAIAVRTEQQANHPRFLGRFADLRAVTQAFWPA